MNNLKVRVGKCKHGLVYGVFDGDVLIRQDGSYRTREDAAWAGDSWVQRNGSAPAAETSPGPSTPVEWLE